MLYLIMKRMYFRNLWYTIGWYKVSSSWHLKLWMRRVQPRRKVSQTFSGSKSYKHLSKTLYWTRRSKTVNNTKSSYVWHLTGLLGLSLKNITNLEKEREKSTMEEVFLKTKSPKNKSCSSKIKGFKDYKTRFLL